jgi:adenosylcobinamide amidohydrolase
VFRHDKALVVQFAGKRKVLSTSLQNGGYREDLTAIFNHDCSLEQGNEGTLQVATYEEYMELTARELGLNPATVSGMATAASMDSIAIEYESYEMLTVTALITGGVDVNGGRVGDPATYFQPVEKTKMHKPGTINIMLFIDADMPPGALARALVTCTEAKTAALQELMVGSNYSCGLATGSGTDSTMVVANPSAKLYLESAGKHAKLGELIGRVVMAATKKTLFKQTGLSPQQQHSVLLRLKRFGISEEVLWKEYVASPGPSMAKSRFFEGLATIDAQPRWVTYTSLYCHLLDQLMWGLLSADEVVAACNDLIAAASLSVKGYPVIQVNNQEECLQAWMKLLVSQVGGCTVEGKLNINF